MDLLCAVCMVLYDLNSPAYKRGAEAITVVGGNALCWEHVKKFGFEFEEERLEPIKGEVYGAGDVSSGTSSSASFDVC